MGPRVHLGYVTRPAQIMVRNCSTYEHSFGRQTILAPILISQRKGETSEFDRTAQSNLLVYMHHPTSHCYFVYLYPKNLQAHPVNDGFDFDVCRRTNCTQCCQEQWYISNNDICTWCRGSVEEICVWRKIVAWSSGRQPQEM